MTTTTNDVVPLPEHLKHCGCRFAPTRHATNCAVAIAFDEIPLRERPEYKEGQRFAAISWDFPFHIRTEVNVGVDIDPVAIILKNLDEYERFELDSCYEPWEKPMFFICQQIEEQIDTDVWFGGRRLSSCYIYTDDIREDPPWTSEDTARLDKVIAEYRNKVVDPNQQQLDLPDPLPVPDPPAEQPKKKWRWFRRNK